MPDWSSSMQQTFEYYEVDPATWKDIKLLTNVKSCTITRDIEAETLGSASIAVTESVGECYIRVYLITIQNGVKEKHPLGTFLVQTPSSSYDGKIRTVTMDAYTPLLELKEKQPPIGYYIPKDENVMDNAYRLTRENVRAPIVKPQHETINHYDFVADTNDTWLSFLSDFIANQLYSTELKEARIYKVNKTNDGYIRTNILISDVKGSIMDGVETTTGEQVYNGTTSDGVSIYYTLIYIKANVTSYRYDIDEMGHIMFSPVQDIKSLQPVWTYDDDNSSILYPELTMDHDLYGIPNVVEVIYSTNNNTIYKRVENNNENSPVSIQNRGREITYRVVNPDMVGEPTEDHIQEYAEQLLDALSSPEYTITYKHGYCPVRLNDGVRLNYSKGGLTNIKAKVISQNISCVPGCPVTEKAVFTTNLWR